MKCTQAYHRALLLLVLTLMPVRLTQAEPKLFQYTSEHSSPSGAETLAARESAFWRTPIRKMRSRIALESLPSEFILNLPGGRSQEHFALVSSRKKARNAPGVSISGTLSKLLANKRTKAQRRAAAKRNHRAGDFSLSVVHAEGKVAVSGYIQTGTGEIFNIETNSRGQLSLIKIDSENMPVCAEAPGVEGPDTSDTSTKSVTLQAAHRVPSLPSSGLQPVSMAAASPTVVKVMVAYTSEARQAAGGTAQILATINNLITYSNSAYQNSSVNTRLELVPYNPELSGEHPDFASNLYDITYPDRRWNILHAPRTEYGADLVALLVNGQQYCGIAWLLPALDGSGQGYGYSVTNWTCTSSFPHELGHNMGLSHDHENSGGNSFFNDAFGYRFYGASGSQWRTIMAYAPGTRIARFSNPDLNYDSSATGVLNYANEARVLNYTAPIVAGYRQDPGPTPTPTNTIPPTPTPLPTATPTPTPTPTPGYYGITGAVTSQGAALSGSQVVLDIHGTSVQRVTGSDGRYSFTDVLGPAPYTLRVTKSGYQFQEYEAELRADTTVNFESLPQNFTLSGIVMDSQRLGISGVLIDGGTLGAAITDSQGRFSFTVPYGINYRLSPSKRGFEFDQLSAAGTVYGDTGRTFVGFEDAAAP